jgi:hypothetical protein
MQPQSETPALELRRGPRWRSWFRGLLVGLAQAGALLTNHIAPGQIFPMPGEGASLPVVMASLNDFWPEATFSEAIFAR